MRRPDADIDIDAPVDVEFGCLVAHLTLEQQPGRF